MMEKKLIIAGQFIDGSGAGVAKNIGMEVTAGVITALGPATELAPQHGGEIIDLSHYTIIPALVDCNVELSRYTADI